MTKEHLLQQYTVHDGLRGAAWPEIIVLRDKVYSGDLAELKRTAELVKATGVDVCGNRSTTKKRKKSRVQI